MKIHICWGSWCYTGEADAIASHLSVHPGDFAALIWTYVRFICIPAKSHALEMCLLYVNCSQECFLHLNHSPPVRFYRRSAKFGFQPAAYWGAVTSGQFTFFYRQKCSLKNRQEQNRHLRSETILLHTCLQVDLGLSAWLVPSAGSCSWRLKLNIGLIVSVRLRSTKISCCFTLQNRPLSWAQSGIAAMCFYR